MRKDWAFSLSLQKPIEVTSVGEILIDFATRDQDDLCYPLLQAHPGGGSINLLAALSAYGAKTSYLGKVGDDAFGGLLKAINRIV